MKLLIELTKKYGIPFVLCVITLEVTNAIFGTVCYFTLLFGIPCPFCGITRATKLMLTGHFKESFQMHPLLILVIIGVILYINLKICLKNYSIYIKSYVIICLVIFVSFYIYRMNKYFPNVEPMLYREDNLLAWILRIVHNRS